MRLSSRYDLGFPPTRRLTFTTSSVWVVAERAVAYPPCSDQMRPGTQRQTALTNRIRMETTIINVTGIALLGRPEEVSQVPTKMRLTTKSDYCTTRLLHRKSGCSSVRFLPKPSRSGCRGIVISQSQLVTRCHRSSTTSSEATTTRFGRHSEKVAKKGMVNFGPLLWSKPLQCPLIFLKNMPKGRELFSERLEALEARTSSLSRL